MIDPITDDGFEVLPTTEEPKVLTEEKSTSVRKLCACGCGEEVTGVRALKRGHSMGTGLQMSSFAPEDVLMVQAAFAGLFMGGTAYIGVRRGIPGMEVEEAQAIANPAGRMFVRHFPKRLLNHMKPGDISDGIAIVSAMSMYSMRVASSNKSKTSGVVNGNGYHADQTVSGLSQYQYTPPEQTIQQENGGIDRSRQ
jgi:hypothetical protein